MLVLYLITINVISFFIYAIDKHKSIKNKYRIPEKVLITCTLLGGFIGTILSMNLFHHKTRKIKFIIITILSIIIWGTIIYFNLKGI